MALRHQIIAVLWAAGGLFTLMLCWMIYTTSPFIMPIPQTMAAIAAITLFWWVAGSMLGRALEHRIQRRMEGMREKLEEHAQLRRRMEKQKSLLEQFAARALPVTSALVEHADTITSQSLEYASARGSVVNTEKLLATTDELSEEIERLAGQARSSSSQADILQQDLEELAAQQPELAGQLQQLAQLAQQFNLLALNASIEGRRSLDRTRGVGLLMQEISELGVRAESMSGLLQSQLGQVSDGAVRSSVACEPLVNQVRALASGAETLALLNDEQWQEIERLHRGSENMPSRDGIASLRYRLVDNAQMLAEKTSMLKHSVEGLVKSLHATA